MEKEKLIIRKPDGYHFKQIYMHTRYVSNLFNQYKELHKEALKELFTYVKNGDVENFRKSREQIIQLMSGTCSSLYEFKMNVVLKKKISLPERDIQVLDARIKYIRNDIEDLFKKLENVSFK